MAAAGGAENLRKHYRETSFFGIVQVLKNLGTIRRQMRECQADVAEFAPDVLILASSGIQHEDGPLGQRARHPHLLLHRLKVWAARMAGEGDPQIRRPASSSSSPSSAPISRNTASRPFSRATRSSTPSRPGGRRSRRPRSSAAATPSTNARSSPCCPAAAGTRSATTCR